MLEAIDISIGLLPILLLLLDLKPLWSLKLEEAIARTKPVGDSVREE